MSTIWAIWILAYMPRTIPAVAGMSLTDLMSVHLRLMLACYVLSPMLDSPCSAGSNVLCVEVKSSVLGGAGWRGWSPYTALCYTYSLYYSLLHLPFPALLIAHKKTILFKSQLFSILPPVTPCMCTILTTKK